MFTADQGYSIGRLLEISEGDLCGRKTCFTTVLPFNIVYIEGKPAPQLFSLYIYTKEALQLLQLS